jgi:hypothetical protein
MLDILSKKRSYVAYDGEPVDFPLDDEEEEKQEEFIF